MKTKNLFSSLHLAAILLIAFLIALFSYLILRTYHHRFDFSEGKVYSLSPQSVQVLEAFKSEPIHVLAFFRDEHSSKWMLEDLLKEYAYHHPKFRYEFSDPDRMPAKAKQYHIDAYETIVIEAKGKREMTKQVSEEAITNLLSKLIWGETKKIVFASGYGGLPLNEKKAEKGFGIFYEKLIASNYEVKESILARDKISKGTDLVILGGPQVDLLPAEIEVLRDYLARKGSVLVLMDPVNPGEGNHLEKFLLEYGVELGDNVIVDKLSKLFGADYLIPLITEYKPHAITSGFRMTSFLPLARSVRKTKETPAGYEVTEFAWTSAGSWAETNLKDLEEGKAEFNEKEDTPGPLPVGVAVQMSKEAKGRLVVFGDSDFTRNAYFNLSGNKDLILNTVAWLAGDDLAISVRPRKRQVTPLYLKETDQVFLFYVPVLGLPIFFLGTSVFVFARRRKFH